MTDNRQRGDKVLYKVCFFSGPWVRSVLTPNPDEIVRVLTKERVDSIVSLYETQGLHQKPFSVVVPRKGRARTDVRNF